jgi:hypothetical protein
VLPATDAPALLLVVSGRGTVEESPHRPFSPRTSTHAWAGLSLFVPAGTDLQLAAHGQDGAAAGEGEPAGDEPGPFLAFHAAALALAGDGA